MNKSERQIETENLAFGKVTLSVLDVPLTFLMVLSQATNPGRDIVQW